MNHRRIGYVALMASALAASAVAPAIARSLGGPMELDDEGTFFVGGRVVHSEFPGAPAFGTAFVVSGGGPGSITIDQMFVHYRIPKAVSAPPIVMVHGSGHSGVTFETTPDGREGWATYFVRKGFPVYVVDHAGRGRSAFDPTAINRARAQSDPKLIPDIPFPTHQRTWRSYHFGPTYPDFYPGSQFPAEAIDQYFAQVLPGSESTLVGEGANTVKGLAALLDRIGPAIVMVHSQSGAYGLDVVRQRTDKVRALIDVEGSCGPLSADDVAKHFAKVPMLALWGDNTVGASGPNGDARRNDCIATIAAIRTSGGSARFLLLPEAGIKGNTHMMMMDRNNLQIADMVISWLGDVGARK